MGDNISVIQSQELRKERPSQPGIPGSKWLRTAWHRSIEWNGWGRIEALIIAGIFYGLRIVVLILEKLECSTHGIVARLRKHRDK